MQNEKLEKCRLIKKKVIDKYKFNRKLHFSMMCKLLITLRHQISKFSKFSLGKFQKKSVF